VLTRKQLLLELGGLNPIDPGRAAEAPFVHPVSSYAAGANAEISTAFKKQLPAQSVNATPAGINLLLRWCS